MHEKVEKVSTVSIAGPPSTDPVVLKPIEPTLPLPSAGRGVISQTLSANYEDISKLRLENGVDTSTILQAALALTLHIYSPSEALSFVYYPQQERSLPTFSPAADGQVCSLRMNDDDTARQVLSLLRSSNNNDAGANASSDPEPRASWASLAGLIMRPCKVAMQFGGSTEEQSPIAALATATTETANSYEIFLSITKRDNGELNATLDFSLLEMAEPIAKSTIHTYGLVLREMCASADKPVQSFNVSSDYDFQMIRDFTTRVSEPDGKCIHDLIVEQLKATPERQAICSYEEEGDMTYGELDALTTRLANHLIELGVKPETYVLACFEQSMWAIVTRLAILRAGGAYVMIEANNPPLYFDSIITRTKAKFLLTQPKFMTRFKGAVPNVMEISRETVESMNLPPALPDVGVTSKNACLLVFTSGSTGQPKAIVQNHDGYATGVRDFVRVLGLDSSTRMLQFDDYAFGISDNEYMSPLIVGGCCCVLSPIRTTFENFTRQINRLEANVSFFTPTVAAQLDPSKFTTLKTVTFGGEATPKGLIRKWSQHLNFIHQYGMGEVTCFVSLNPHTTADQSTNIGWPGSGAIYIVVPGAPDRLAPVGAIGEILLEAPTISRGYLDDIVDTSSSARFLAKRPDWLVAMHPDRSNSTDQRLYLSGDLARYNHDGSVEHIGRKDHMLKVNGNRVDAAEVEFCARAALPDPEGDTVIVGLRGTITEDDGPELTTYLYIRGISEEKERERKEKDDENKNEKAKPILHWDATQVPGAAEVVEGVKKAIGEKLPPHNLPTAFLLVDRIPRTATKKTDRKKLSMSVEGI